ncbi:hypothetical protein JKP88DRAFT_252038 [Tribonema minus]|uniref:Uncharacterized protein n=1 Tax=Tribonema minus TaxID=303371 RepID=A0A836CLH2_9STRA|nr:hypothetical protein JKP88DRAFT_252038 [Tribonema minus]
MSSTSSETEGSMMASPAREKHLPEDKLPPLSLTSLADTLSTSWPPNQVPMCRKLRLAANAVFTLLLAGFASFAAWAIVTALKQRSHPPVFFYRNTSATSFAMPVVTLCVEKRHLSEDPAAQYSALQVGAAHCVIVEPRGSSMRISPTNCFQLQATFRRVDPHLDDPGLGVHALLQPDTPIWFNVLLTSSVPDETSPSGYYINEGRFGTSYDAQITKQIRHSFRPAHDGKTSYSMATNYDGDSGLVNKVTFNFRASGLGVDVLVEQDPLDLVTLLGSLAGYFPNVLTLFGLLFAPYIARNLRQAEEH